MKNISILVVLLAYILLISCSSSDDTNETPTTKTVTYEKNIKIIMEDNCMACHIDPPVNGAPMHLTTYQSVKESVQNRNLIGRIEDGSMPPGNNELSAEEIQALKDWKENNFEE